MEEPSKQDTVNRELLGPSEPSVPGHRAAASLAPQWDRDEYPSFWHEQGAAPRDQEVRMGPSPPVGSQPRAGGTWMSYSAQAVGALGFPPCL